MSRGRCLLDGMRVSPEMGGPCGMCGIYLETCLPMIKGGYLVGAECDIYFCEGCFLYRECPPFQIKARRKLA